MKLGILVHKMFNLSRNITLFALHFDFSLQWDKQKFFTVSQLEILFKIFSSASKVKN